MKDLALMQRVARSSPQNVDCSPKWWLSYPKSTQLQGPGYITLAQTCFRLCYMCCLTFGNICRATLAEIGLGFTHFLPPPRQTHGSQFLSRATQVYPFSSLSRYLPPTISPSSPPHTLSHLHYFLFIFLSDLSY